MVEEEKLYDILIIGGGPAGLAAAIYAGRAGLSILVIERAFFGGTVFQTAEIENYPGGMKIEPGADFAIRMEAQARAFGAELIHGAVTSVKLAGMTKEVSLGDNVYKGRTIIIATGSTPSRLGVPGEVEFTGLGVSYCAVCDGPFFSGRDVFVVGGGNSALEESLHLAKIVRKVTIIHRRDAFRAEKFIVEKARNTDNIEFMTDTVVKEVGGDGLLTRIVTENVKTGEQQTIEAAEGENFGFFIFAGIKPQSELFVGDIELIDGYILTDEDMKTNIPGVYAAGDIRYKTLRQVVTATADGALAATSINNYLSSQ